MSPLKDERKRSASFCENDLTSIKQQNYQLEVKLYDKQDETDNLASEIEILEQSRLRMKKSFEELKMEHTKELEAKDEEIEALRHASKKKLNSADEQLEAQLKDSMKLKREKNLLETKVIDLQGIVDTSTKEAHQIHKLKKENKRITTLLQAAWLTIERHESDTSFKTLIRQLQDQLEDSEHGRITDLKSKKHMERELADLKQGLEHLQEEKLSLENNLSKVLGENLELQAQIDNNSEEVEDIMKRYHTAISQLSQHQSTIQEQASHLCKLEAEQSNLKQQIAEMTQKLESDKNDYVPKAKYNCLELKLKEMEANATFVETVRKRNEVQIKRHRGTIEYMKIELDGYATKNLDNQELMRKMKRQIRELEESETISKQKQFESETKTGELKRRLECADIQRLALQKDVKGKEKRIEKLQETFNWKIDIGSESFADYEGKSIADDDVFVADDQTAMGITLQPNTPSPFVSPRSQNQYFFRHTLTSARKSLSGSLQTLLEEPEEAILTI